MPSKERSSQNTMKRKSELRSRSIRPGRLSMSSRWISISFSRSAGLRSMLILACVGLHQRRLAHAARAPEQRVVGGQAVGEALGVLDQDVAHPVDALEQAKVDAADARHRRKASVRMPDKGVGGAERLRARRRRRGRGKVAGDGFQRGCDPLGGGVVERALPDVLSRFLLVCARRLWGWRGALFSWAFFDIFGVPDRAALSGLGRSRKRPK